MNIMNIVSSVVTITGMGLIFGVGLGFAAVKFHIDTDPKLDKIIDALPGANCGGCGFPGCEALANAILEGTAKSNSCPVGGKESATNISNILGVKDLGIERLVSFVKCMGKPDVSESKYTYYGVDSCKMIHSISDGSPKKCGYGCLGAGDCVRGCQFGAITIVDGIAFVDREKCTACGMCVDTCPKKIIELIPYRSEVFVACHSYDKGRDVRKNCTVGCIGCRMCVKVCEFDAIIMDDLLAVVDYEKCTACGTCVEKCPTKSILSLVPEKAKV